MPPVPKGIAKDGKVRTPQREIPLPSEKGRWIVIRSPRFEVISDAGEQRTRAIVKDIETLASALGGATGWKGVQAQAATMFLFAERRDSQPYFDLLFARDRAPATGAYVRHDGGGTMFVDGSRRDRIERTAMHELIHDLLRQTDVAPPLWLEEGLAEYFSGAAVDGNRVIAGEPIREHLAYFKQRSPIPLAELFAIQAESPAAASAGFYAQSWLAVDWLMYADHEAFFPFLREVSHGGDVAAALRAHYGRSLRDLEMGLRVRNRGSRRVVLQGTTPHIPPAQPLDRATLLYELGQFLSHVAGAEREVERHYKAALAANPRHALTLAATGDLEGAVAAAPDDPAVHLIYAEVLMTTATGPFAGIFEPAAGDVEKFRKARQVATRALELGGDAGLAHGLIGTSMLVESDVQQGIAHLERARELLPQRMDFALNLYAMYLASGDRVKADALFASTLANARDRQTVFAARNVLLAAETARANQLTQSGQLDEAAAIVRTLAAATTDPAGRRELERQAAQLESTATVNRHIALYNDAIALSNTGRTREAVKVLDELLEVATDEEVVRDARELRAELRKRLRS